MTKMQYRSKILQTEKQLVSMGLAPSDARIISKEWRPGVWIVDAPTGAQDMGFVKAIAAVIDFYVSTPSKDVICLALNGPCNTSLNTELWLLSRWLVHSERILRAA